MLQTYTSSQLLAPSSSNILEEVIEVITLAFTEDPATKWLFTNHKRPQYLTAIPHYFRFLVFASLQAGAIVVVSREDPKPTSNEEPAPAPSASSPTPLTGKIQAAAITILPSGNAKMGSYLNALRAGFLGVVWHCGLGVIWRLFTQLLPAMEALEARLYPNPADRGHHYTLLFLGARPGMQGKGLGKTLLLELQRIVSEAAAAEAPEATAAADGTGKNGKSDSTTATNATITTGPKRLGPAPLYLEASTPTSKRLYERVGFVTRDTTVYGKLDEQQGKDIDIRENGEVVGGRMFAMFWSPVV